MKPSVGQSVDEFSGSGMKQMEEAEDDGVYDTFSDDEDVTSSAMTDIRLNLACTYPLDSDFPSVNTILLLLSFFYYHYYYYEKKFKI